MRPLWKGLVTFGLVSVPVGLYSATRRQAELHFRLLHEKDQAPIDYRRFCTEEDVEVDWKDIVKGYEYEKGRFVVVTDEDFERARVAGTHTIEIRDFVPAGDIDFAYFETPYWLVPDGPGRKAYALLREALEESGRVGIGTIVIRERERLLALRPAGPGLMLTTMRFASELRAVGELDMPQPAAASKKELALALQLVETLAGPFKPEQYHDAYTEALRAVIEAKIEGKKVSAPKTSRPPRVISLVDALRKSLAAPRAAGQAKTVVRKRARRRERPHSLVVQLGQPPRIRHRVAALVVVEVHVHVAPTPLIIRLCKTSARERRARGLHDSGGYHTRTLFEGAIS